MQGRSVAGADLPAKLTLFTESGKAIAAGSAGNDGHFTFQFHTSSPFIQLNDLLNFITVAENSGLNQGPYIASRNSSKLN